MSSSKYDDSWGRGGVTGTLPYTVTHILAFTNCVWPSAGKLLYIDTFFSSRMWQFNTIIQTDPSNKYWDIDSDVCLCAGIMWEAVKQIVTIHLYYKHFYFLFRKPKGEKLFKKKESQFGKMLMTKLEGKLMFYFLIELDCISIVM